jgi:hypothetical protein
MQRIFVLLMVALPVLVHAQSTNDLMIGGGVDVYKTDNNDLIDKVQAGVEANFFVKRNFTTTAGLESWSERQDSFVFGSRWYFTDHFFSRYRALIGENDFSIGLGGAIPLSSNFRFEIIGDYYFKEQVALRCGLAYVFRL